MHLQRVYYCLLVLLTYWCAVEALPQQRERESKVLSLTPSQAPLLDKRSAQPRSVNLSFFVPAFSLFALASQFMPQMFPALATATTSSRSAAGKEPPKIKM